MEKDQRQAFADTLHELNQPLTAINNYAQAGRTLLERGDTDPERLRDLFRKIAVQSARSVEISKALRHLAKPGPADAGVS